MKILFVLFFILNIHSTTSWSAPQISQIGKHHPILLVEKNVNPDNTMVVYTKTDEKCQFDSETNGNKSILFDFYWLMNRKDYKPVHKAIKKEIRKSMQIDKSAKVDANKFTVKLTNLEKVKTDISDPRLTVTSKILEGKCKVEGLIQLGPSDDNAQIRLDSLYTEGRKFPPAVFSVTLKGVNIKTGKPIARTYRAP